MITHWARAHFDAGLNNVVLGFQPTEGLAGSIATPVPAKIERPKQSWMDRLDRWFWRQEQKQRDAYLAGAADIFELEQRMRMLDRATSRGFL
jgi:hypothetical protein